MRRWISLILSALMLFFMQGCQRAANQADAGMEGDAVNGAISQTGDENLCVVATIFPQYDFVREIAGDKVELRMLLPPGSESHSFEPTPKDIIAIQNCDVFIYTGGSSDTWVDGILNSMDTSGMKILSLVDLVDTLREELVEGMESEGETHAEETEFDEHVWTSPRNAVRIVQAISDTLCELDSANAELYQRNTTVYVEKLDELNTLFQAIVDGAERKTMVFADQFAFRYLADAYGLTYYAAFPGCSTQTEASASTIAFLIDKINEENIPVVFYREFSNEKMADTICESTGAQKLLLHSCHNITKSDFESGVNYLEIMKRNGENLKEALQ